MRLQLNAMVLVVFLGTTLGCSQRGPVSISPDPALPVWDRPSPADVVDFSLPADVLDAQDARSVSAVQRLAPAVSMDIDADRVYTLPELIDIAQSSRPTTRAAWLRAREAAKAVEVVRSTYLPQLSANILAGYERVSRVEPAIPELGIGAGRLTAEGSQLVPNLTVEWLLFDFGARDAARDIAEQTALASNILFHGAHQAVIFEVSEAYLRLLAARAEVRINQERVKDAAALREVAEERLRDGLAIKAEVAQARQIEARAQFDLRLAETRVTTSHAALMQDMGLSPTSEMQIADLSDRRLPKDLPAPLDEMIQSSLAKRPDIQAALARVRATRSEVTLAEAQSRPTVAALANIGPTYGRFGITDSRFHGRVSRTDRLDNYLVGVVVTVPLFDGGRREVLQAQARLQSQAAQEDLLEMRNSAAREIVEAYSLLQTSLAAYSASGPLVDAGQETFETALGLYENGLASLVEVSETKLALNDARLIRTQAFADTFAAATALAFATGRLTNRDSPFQL